MQKVTGERNPADLYTELLNTRQKVEKARWLANLDEVSPVKDEALVPMHKVEAQNMRSSWQGSSSSGKGMMAAAVFMSQVQKASALKVQNEKKACETWERDCIIACSVFVLTLALAWACSLAWRKCREFWTRLRSRQAESEEEEVSRSDAQVQCKLIIGGVAHPVPCLKAPRSVVITKSGHSVHASEDCITLDRSREKQRLQKCGVCCMHYDFSDEELKERRQEAVSSGAIRGPSELRSRFTFVQSDDNSADELSKGAKGKGKRR